MPSRARIGIFGGSFDPPHFGHLICTKAAALALDLKKILVIPAALQPLKPEGAAAGQDCRLAMVEAAFMSDPIYEIDTLELQRGGKSYTIDTLRELAGRYPRNLFELTLLLGADALGEIHRWKEPEAIFSLVAVASMVRKGFVPPDLPARWGVHLIELDTPSIDISSHDIRRRVAEGRSISGLVPETVEKLIRADSLYIVPNGTRSR